MRGLKKQLNKIGKGHQHQMSLRKLNPEVNVINEDGDWRYKLSFTKLFYFTTNQNNIVSKMI